MKLFAPRSKLPQGSMLAVQNSDRLVASAKILAAQGDFATASSLLVLAAEELIKAFIWMIKGMGMHLPLPSQRRFTTDHRTRHEIARFQTFTMYLMGRFFDWHFDLQERFKDDTVGLRKARKTEFEKYLDVVRNLDTDHVFNRLMEWWENANRLKNFGLYVDFDGEKWRTPESVGEADYAQSLEVVNEWREVVGESVRQWAELGDEERRSLGRTYRSQMRQAFPKDPPE